MHAYTEALIREMEAFSEKARDYTVDTVFFGGGTPTLMPLSDIEAIIEAVRRCFCVHSDAEITLEANPATADREKLRALRTLGFNRISVGVKSFSDKELNALGRVHTAAEAKAFLWDVREAGFFNVNIDLMYGIPHQTPESFQKTLKEALSHAPEHISAYSLIIEEGTPFFERCDTLPLPSEDTEALLHNELCKTLGEAGYSHYEISNFAREGYLSRHNLRYWRCEEYLGFGAAAYSFFGGERYGNVRDMDKYMKNPTDAVFEKEVLSEQALAYEYIMLHLRTSEGLSLNEYERRFGVKLKQRYREEISRFCALGWLKDGEDTLALTEEGMRFSNTVLVAFMEDF